MNDPTNQPARRAAGVGKRIREAREAAEKTQNDIAKLLGLSRAAIAQWENDITSPSLQKVEELARLLGKSPEWIAYGVTAEPVVRYRDPEDQGYVTVPEMLYGATPEETVEVQKWGLPLDWLKTELNCPNTSKLVVYRVEDHGMEPTYEFGDRLIVDTANNRPNPNGTFLIWTGVGVALAKVTVYPSPDLKAKPKARVDMGAGAETFEVLVDQLTIIGKVKSVFKRAS